MEIHTFVNPKMTSSNLNKIIRTNLNLNSKILSKNTNEIVNTCIGKLYKQIPMTFKNGLQRNKLATEVKSENYGPVERYKMLERKRQQTTGIKPLKGNSNVYETQMLCNLMNMSRKPAPLTPRKLLKTTSYKIFNTKRYCSSVSSSSGSILYRKEDKQRSMRNYCTPAKSNVDKVLPKRSVITQHNPAALIMPTRNQHMSSKLDSMQRAMKVSGQIQKDLMAIDKLLKNRLKVAGKGMETKTTNGPAVNAKDCSQFKEQQQKKQIPNKPQIHKQIKDIANTLERKKTIIPLTETVKPLKRQKLYHRTTISESRNVPGFPDSNEENKQKTPLKTHFIRYPAKEDKLSEQLVNSNVLKKPALDRTNIEESRKPLKAKGNIVPSATYWLLKPNHFPPMEGKTKT
ncbi:uncharacterized protein LOC111677459 [Lucilia cuprina]|uniref:uncharacterized protein LOC111677459 n=1 Tax=Lucilia cuprina TaxID=7375 RepID=UPI001F05353D|nr:uncharacterized protein LOC111677459 [Lucilia cuprina]